MCKPTPPERRWAHQGQQLDGERMQDTASRGEKSGGNRNVTPCRKPLRTNEKRHGWQVVADRGKSEGEGTRTLNHRIDSPVL